MNDGTTSVEVTIAQAATTTTNESTGIKLGATTMPQRVPTMRSICECFAEEHLRPIVGAETYERLYDLTVNAKSLSPKWRAMARATPRNETTAINETAKAFAALGWWSVHPAG